MRTYWRTHAPKHTRTLAHSHVYKYARTHRTQLYSTIVIDDNGIERVTQTKLFGVALSADLSWNAHVYTIVYNYVFTIQ